MLTNAAKKLKREAGFGVIFSARKAQFFMVSGILWYSTV